MNTPSSVSIDSTLSTMSCTPSMCANTLVAVTTCARPHCATTSAAADAPKKRMIERMPRSLARFAISVGSTPQTGWPAERKFSSSVPSFEPTSTTSSVPRRPSKRRRFALQFGEVVAQDLRRPAGVGILGRKQNRRIDDQAELHELALLAVQDFGGVGRLLVRALPDRAHLVDRRKIAEKQHRLKFLRAAHLTTVDDDAATGTGGAR